MVVQKAYNGLPSPGLPQGCLGWLWALKLQEYSLAYGFTDWRGKPAGRGGCSRGSRNQVVAGMRARLLSLHRPRHRLTHPNNRLHLRHPVDVLALQPSSLQHLLMHHSSTSFWQRVCIRSVLSSP